MGLFDWIGEAIGGAFHALAEFIGDAIQGILGGAGSLFKNVSRDLIKDVVVSVDDPTDPLRKGAETLHNKATEPITKGFDHTIETLGSQHSEITPSQAAKEVTEIHETIRRDTGAAMISNILIEAASLGQVEGPMTSFNVADRISGATSFAAQVAAMKYKALWLNSYEYHLNASNPNIIPGPSDLIRFAFREVWDEGRRAELLADGYPVDFQLNMLWHGYNSFWTDSYWAAHWELPSVTQLNEMLHRRVITPETWDRFVKYNDYDPIVRPWLKAISYLPYTRVDVRRMWELALLTDDEVLSNYMDQGYDENHARRLTIWTKVYTASVELRARYSKGWITEADIVTELTNMGMPAERAKVWVQRLVKAEKETRTLAERDLTKAEIVKGVKKELITSEDGVDLLIDMGYDEAEAEYIIAVNVEALTGSPETYSEFKTLVDLRRKSLGLRTKEALPALVEIDERLSFLFGVRDAMDPKVVPENEFKKINDEIAGLQQKSQALRKK